MTFSEKILYLRKTKEIPQNKLAKTLNVSRQSIYKWESGACMPELDKIKKMAEIFEVSYDILLNDEMSLCTNEEKAQEKSSFIKNKKLILIAFTFLIVIAVVLLAFFNFFKKEDIIDTNKHTLDHKTEIKYIIKKPTCQEKGKASFGCLECDYSELMEIEFTDHEISNHMCIYCDYIEGSNGIEYGVSDDNTCYVKSIGSCKDTEIFIASTFEGKLVTKIAKNSFDNTNIKSLTMPKTIITIEEDAFKNCVQLEKITFNEGLKTIGNGAFSYCGTINNIIIPDTTEKIGNSAFESTIIDSLIIGESVIEIGERAFYGSVFRDGVTFKDPYDWVMYNTKFKRETSIKASYNDIRGYLSASYSIGFIWYKR